MGLRCHGERLLPGNERVRIRHSCGLESSGSFIGAGHGLTKSRLGKSGATRAAMKIDAGDPFHAEIEEEIIIIASGDQRIADAIAEFQNEIMEVTGRGHLIFLDPVRGGIPAQVAAHFP